jgi:GT2 family glycosyltransferase
MATTPLRISIIMVDGAFRQSYHAVDFFCTQDFPTDEFELLWVEFTDYVHPQLAEAVARYPNARIITLNQSGDYHPALCFNAGIEAARGDLLVIPDADQACEPDTLQRLWDAHQRDERLVMYLFRYDEPEDQHIEPIALETLAHLQQVCHLRSPSNFGACLTVRKRWLLEINGYDRYWPFHTGFHAHGLDVNTRLKNLGLPIVWHPGIKLYHSGIRTPSCRPN